MKNYYKNYLKKVVRVVCPNSLVTENGYLPYMAIYHNQLGDDEQSKEFLNCKHGNGFCIYLRHYECNRCKGRHSAGVHEHIFSSILLNDAVDGGPKVEEDDV